MTWVPNTPMMNVCPNPRCRSRGSAPHVDRYTATGPIVEWYHGECPSCGIRGPKAMTNLGAVEWWNLSFPEEGVMV